MKNFFKNYKSTIVLLVAIIIGLIFKEKAEIVALVATLLVTAVPIGEEIFLRY